METQLVMSQFELFASILVSSLVALSVQYAIYSKKSKKDRDHFDMTIKAQSRHLEEWEENWDNRDRDCKRLRDQNSDYTRENYSLKEDCIDYQNKLDQMSIIAIKMVEVLEEARTIVRATLKENDNFLANRGRDCLSGDLKEKARKWLVACKEVDEAAKKDTETDTETETENEDQQDSENSEETETEGQTNVDEETQPTREEELEHKLNQEGGIKAAKVPTETEISRQEQ